MARKYRQIDPRIWDDEEFRSLYARRWKTPSPRSPSSHPWPFDKSRWKESHCVTQKNRLSKKCQRQKVWQYFEHIYGSTKCFSCRRRKATQIDHVLPITWGGTSDLWNLQPLCGRCNATKGQMVPIPPESCHA